MSSATTNDIFGKPLGAVFLDPKGRWWMTRGSTELKGGELTVLVSDGQHVAEITGTPYALRRLADGIHAQVESAEVNTPGVP